MTQTRTNEPAVAPNPDASGNERSVVVALPEEGAARRLSLAAKLPNWGWNEVLVPVASPATDVRSTLDRLADRPNVRVLTEESETPVSDALDAAGGEVVGYVPPGADVDVADLHRVYATVETGPPEVAVATRESACRRGALDRLRETLGRRARTDGAPAPDRPPHLATAFDRAIWEQATDSDDPGRALRDAVVEPVAVGATPRPDRHTEDHLAALASARRGVGNEDEDLTASAEDPLRVGLVTCFPPHRGNLAEYGYNLAAAYGERSDVDLTVIACRHEDAPRVERRDGYEVRRVWSRDSLRGAGDVLRAVRDLECDVVQFNVQMTYFGSGNCHRFLGMALPALTRALSSATVVTTLHDMLEVVDEDSIDERVGLLERAGARTATQLALLAHATTVTAPEYADIVEERYYVPTVNHVPHGTFRSAGEAGSERDSPFRVLVFGHLDPKKKDVETVIEAFDRLSATNPDAELVVAGDSHPEHPGYRRELEERYGDRPGVRFTGYVPEDELDDVWGRASVVVLPYRTCTGVSGVFQLAKSYGTPVIATDVEGIRESTVRTGGAAEFVESNDPRALAEKLDELRADPDRLRELGQRNAAASSDQTMFETAEKMVGVFRSASEYAAAELRDPFAVLSGGEPE